MKQLKEKEFNLAKKNRPWCLPMAIVLVVRIAFYSTLESYTLYPDSTEYMEYPFRNLLHFQLGNGRMPIYPIIIRICRLIAGEQYFLNLVVWIQMAASLGAAFVFYKICDMLIQNEKLKGLLTVLYACNPAIIGWDNIILSESLALSGTVVFLYTVLRYLQKPSFKWGTIATVWALALTFERPTFLLFACLLLGFWILRCITCKEERAILTRLIAISCGGFLLLGGYGCLFYRTFGYFSISDPLPRQLLQITIERDYYRSEENSQLVAEIDQILAECEGDAWKTKNVLIEKYGEKKSLEFAKKWSINNIGQYAKDTWDLAKSMTTDNLDVRYYGVKNWQDGLEDGFWQVIPSLFAIFKMVHVYAAIAAEAIILTVLWIWKKEIPWIHLGLFAFLLLIPLSTYIATYAEYIRTMIHVVPFLYTALAIYLNWFFSRTSIKGIKEI